MTRQFLIASEHDHWVRTRIVRLKMAGGIVSTLQGFPILRHGGEAQFGVEVHHVALFAGHLWDHLQGAGGPKTG